MFPCGSALLQHALQCSGSLLAAGAEAAAASALAVADATAALPASSRRPEEPARDGRRRSSTRKKQQACMRGRKEKGRWEQGLGCKGDARVSPPDGAACTATARARSRQAVNFMMKRLI